MNRNVVLSMTGQIVSIEALLLVLPLVVSLLYGDGDWWAFALTIAAALLLGLALMRLFRPKRREYYAKEGFVITALAWLALSALGALPFVLTGTIPSYVDALFETVSGFTTTGATILSNVEAVNPGLLFWRSFTHWVGGMGILVLLVAVLPTVSGNSIHVLRAEMPGPTMGKLVPRLRDTAKILYLIYIAMTLTEILLLLLGGMPLFDSIVHSFGTAGTGGFGVRSDSIASYSRYCQWVITVFMFLFGVNFNLYYMLLIKKFRPALRSTELWAYIGIAVTAVVLVAWNIYPLYGNLGDTVRNAAFQISSIMTTTGYSTADFNLWPELSRTILVILMFIGACAGSTGGGLKVSRVVLLFRTVKREVRHMLHPRTVSGVRFEGRHVENETLISVNNYFALYIGLFGLMLLVLSFEKSFDFTSNFSAVAACFNNIGPGLNLVGPIHSYADYSAVSKLVLTVGMLLGRLEIYPLLILISPGTWLKK